MQHRQDLKDIMVNYTVMIRRWVCGQMKMFMVEDVLLSLLTCLSQTNKLAVVVVMPKAYQYHSYWFATHTVILPASSPTPI